MPERNSAEPNVVPFVSAPSKNLFTDIHILENLWDRVKQDSALLIEGIKDVRILILQICKNFTRFQRDPSTKKEISPCIFIAADEKSKNIIKFAKERLGWLDIEEDIKAHYLTIFTREASDEIKGINSEDLKRFWENPVDFILGVKKIFLAKKAAFSNQPQVIAGKENKDLFNNGLIIFDSVNSLVSTTNWPTDIFLKQITRFKEDFVERMLLIFTIDKETLPANEKNMIYNEFYYDICQSSLKFKDEDCFKDGRTQSFLQLNNIYSIIDTFWIPFLFLAKRGLVSYNDITAESLRIIAEAALREKKVEQVSLNIINEQIEKMKQKDWKGGKYPVPEKWTYLWPIGFPSTQQEKIEPVKINANRLVTILTPWCPWDNYWIICNLIFYAWKQGFPTLYISIDDNPNSLIYNWGLNVDKLNPESFKEDSEWHDKITINGINSSPEADTLKWHFHYEMDKFKMMNYINAAGGETNNIKDADRIVKDIMSVNQLSEMLQNIKEFDKAFLLKDVPIVSVPAIVILNSYSGLYVQVEAARAFSFLQKTYNDLIWKKPKNRIIFNIIQKKMIPEPEIQKIIQMSDSVIEFQEANVLGNNLSMVKIDGVFEGNIKKNNFYFFKLLKISGITQNSLISGLLPKDILTLTNVPDLPLLLTPDVFNFLIRSREIV